jgi:predicted small lipoprotein YifL
MNIRRLKSVIILSLLSLCISCGQRGPLFLPQPENPMVNPEK